MGRKVLISFLGTGNYIPCRYIFESNESSVVTYVQSAIIEILASDFDEYLIFCTESAQKKHFESLKKEANRKVTCVSVPNGLSEEEIWKIFEIVFERLTDSDEVIYDITHSFRSLPMLGMVLLQYAKFIKKIKVRGIFYGAFEVLGSGRDVETNYPDPINRKVPLLNLTSFSQLQDWSNSGSEFLSSGKADRLVELAKGSLIPMIKNRNGKEKTAIELKKIAEELEKVSLDFRTNRGEAFIKADKIIRLMDQIEAIKKDLLPPFIPILKTLKHELKDFKEGEIDNLFHSVEWNINKGLIQEGITMLQEMIITKICSICRMNYKDRRVRDVVTSYLSFGVNNPPEQWKEPLKSATEIVGKLKSLKDINIDELGKCFSRLTTKRNSINHGGFTAEEKSKDFQDKLKKSYQEIKMCFNVH